MEGMGGYWGVWRGTLGLLGQVSLEGSLHFPSLFYPSHSLMVVEEEEQEEEQGGEEQEEEGRVSSSCQDPLQPPWGAQPNLCVSSPPGLPLGRL